MKYVIETERLTKNFGALAAVDEVSLHVQEGEIYGFLGLNGAGKTTVIRMLLGLARPSSGKVFLEGMPILSGRQGPWARVGYLVEMPYSYPELSVFENLLVIARLRSLRGKGPIDQIIEQLQLEPYRHVKARNLSLGNAQRLGLAKALMHRPDILILDEPTNGLDPAGIVEVREMLRAMAKDQGITIFISSHILGEISRLATRIGIIHQGRLIQEIDARELDAVRSKKLLLDPGDRPALVEGLQKLGLKVAQREDQLLEVMQEEELESYFLRIIHQSQPSDG
ncbi:MAG: ABC transporter ATP-binding protein [Saprospirales bacterium]|nr:ABC transporter ATP-binding protein [Saprospirales bacterium]